jgi:putative peptidoglycan lipid II flippase
MVNKILNHKSKTIFSAALILATTALASRFLGLIRDRLLAGKFGAGDELDAYFAAFRLPDFVYSILIMGAVSAAFIPVFAEYFKRDENEAWRLTSGLLNLILIILVVFCALFIILAPFLMPFIAPGFTGEKREMAIALTRIMFLSPLLLGISSIFSGVLQYFHRFFVYSLAPIMYNLGIIIGILFFVPSKGIVGLAWGVVLGAFLHLLIQLPSAIYSGWKWRKILTVSHEGIRKIIKMMIPRTIGLAGTQINFLAITAIASTLMSGSIAIFNLSYNLQYVPIGIIGISFATAVFPRLSRSFADKNKEEFSSSFSSAFGQILFLVMPIMVLFFLLRAQIVRIVLGTGQFGWSDTRLTAAALGIFTFGVFAQSLIPLISRSFYSVHNTKTPVLISLWSILINIFASLFFVWILRGHNWLSSFISQSLKLEDINNFSVLALPMAYALAGIFNFIFLLRAFNKKINFWKPQNILNSLSKIIASCALMAISVYALLRIGNLFLNTRTFFGIFIQTAIAVIGGAIIYFISSFLFKSPETKILMGRIFRKNGTE